MYARVARWEGADGEAMRRSAEEIDARSADGPPEGVPVKAFLLLIDPEGGRSLSVTLFETEADYEQGDRTLDAMSPPDDALGRRVAVERYEVAADLRV